MLTLVAPSISSLLVSALCLSVISAVVLELPVWFRNSYALVEVNIGTPPQKRLLHFDSGSATAWLVDSKCANGGCENYSGYDWHGYDQNASSASESLGTYATIEYLGGVTSGFGVSDVFSVPSAPSFSWKQTFLQANASSWFWIPADGFVGLSFSSTLAVANTTTIVETLLWSRLLDQPRFGLYYGKELNNTNEVAGEGVLTLGTSEEDKYVMEGDS